MHYDFWYTVEQCYTSYILEKYLKQLASEGQVTFQVVKKESIMSQ